MVFKSQREKVKPDINIFDYGDFRQYLKAYQEARQAIDKNFTKAQFCKELGLPNTRSYFTNVLRDKIVTKPFIERFIKVLELDDREAQFFRSLVQYNQSKTPSERELLFDQLVSLNQTPKKFIPKESYAYYKEWHHAAIRAALDVIPFKGDYKDLGKQLVPAISAKKVKDSIALLEKLELIAQDESGRWRPTDKSITTGPYVKEAIIQQYQSKCIELGQTALVDSNPQFKNFSTVTLSVSDDILKMIEKKLQTFKSEIRSMVHKDNQPANQMYQLNIQLFPQLKR